jgi:hypothetical protein
MAGTRYTHRAYNSYKEIERLVSEFEACTLPYAEWDHRAHLTIGLWYLARHKKPEATMMIRRNIQKYNRACGITQTKTTGYHETITLFYVWLVSKYLKNSERSSSIIELVNGLLRNYGDKSLPFEYYSKERLMSWNARINWVEPDLKPLD